MTYEEFKQKIKSHGFTIDQVMTIAGYNRGSVQKYAKNHNGSITERHEATLDFALFQADDFLQSCAKHRENKALIALVDQLEGGG